MGEVSYQVHISVETFKQAVERSGIDFSILHIKVFDNAEEDEGNDMVVDVNEWVIVEFSINTNKKNKQMKSVDADDGNFLEAQFYKADDTKSSRGH